MADMDTGGASNRQAPATVRRDVAKPKIAATRKPLRRTVSKSSTNKNYSNNKQQNYTRAANRRSESRKSTPRSTPKPVQPAQKKIVPPAPPKPVIPDINKFLAGDSTYQRQLAAFGKSLADFQADQGLAQTDYNTNYGNTYRDIGLAKTDAAGNLEEDYASRGLLKSGLYNQALGELNQQYQNQFTDLGSQKTAFMDQLAQELKKYQNEQSTQKGNAYNEAVRRRAERYNL
jgi:hypothetical protein